MYASDARSAEAQYVASFGQYVAAHSYALGHLSVGVGVGVGVGAGGTGLPGGGANTSSSSGSSVGSSLALKDLVDVAAARHIGGGSATAAALRS